MNKIEISEGFIIYDDTTSEEALCQFKEYIGNQQKFLNENGIEWVKGTILKGSGSTYAEFEGMSSAKSVQKIEAMFVTSKQYELLKELIDSFENGNDISKEITERIDNGNYLFMANLQNFERVAEPIRNNSSSTSINKIALKHISRIKKVDKTVEAGTNVGKTKELTSLQIKKTKRIISPSELYRKIRKK